MSTLGAFDRSSLGAFLASTLLGRGFTATFEAIKFELTQCWWAEYTYTTGSSLSIVGSRTYATSFYLVEEGIIHSLENSLWSPTGAGKGAWPTAFPILTTAFGSVSYTDVWSVHSGWTASTTPIPSFSPLFDTADEDAWDFRVWRSTNGNATEAATVTRLLHQRETFPNTTGEVFAFRGVALGLFPTDPTKKLYAVADFGSDQSFTAASTAGAGIKFGWNVTLSLE